MKRAKYRGDLTAEFRVGQILGRTNAGDFVRATAIRYDEASDQTIVEAERDNPAAPPGQRLRFHGQTDDA